MAFLGSLGLGGAATLNKGGEKSGKAELGKDTP